MDFTVSAISFLSPALVFLFTITTVVILGAAYYIFTSVGFSARQSSSWASAIGLTFGLIILVAVVYFNAWAFSQHVIMTYKENELAEASGLTLNKDFKVFWKATEEGQSVTGFFEKINLYSGIHEDFKATLRAQRPFVPIGDYSLIKDYMNACFSEELREPVLNALNYYPVPQDKVNTLINKAHEESESQSDVCQMIFRMPPFIHPVERN